MTALTPAKPVERVPLHELVERWAEAQARPCLCGGVVVANPVDPSNGVRAHQRSEEHRTFADRVYGE